jgi:hypothetical protein
VAGRIDDAPLRRLAEALDRIDDVRRTLVARADVMADERFGALRETVAAMLQQHVHAGGKAADKERVAAQVTEAVQGAHRSATAAFELQATGELARLEETLRTSIPTAPIGDPSAPRPVGGVPGLVAEGLDPVAVARRLTAVAALFAPQVARQAAKSGATAAGETLARQAASELAEKAAISAGKDGAAAAGKSAGGAAAKGVGRWLGPVVLVAVAAWEVFDGYRKAQAQDRMVAAALRQAESQAALVSASAKDDFKARAHAFVNGAVGPAAARLRAALEAATGGAVQAKGAVVELSRLRERLDSALERLSERMRS